MLFYPGDLICLSSTTHQACVFRVFKALYACEGNRIQVLALFYGFSSPTLLRYPARKTRYCQVFISSKWMVFQGVNTNIKVKNPFWYCGKWSYPSYSEVLCGSGFGMQRAFDLYHRGKNYFYLLVMKSIFIWFFCLEFLANKSWYLVSCLKFYGAQH